MKSILFPLFILLLLHTDCSASYGTEECTPVYWAGTYSRMSGGGCDGWKTKTESTLTVRINPFDSTLIIFYTCESRSVTGCEITTTYTDKETHYEKERNEISVTSYLTGCRVIYKKQ